MCVYKIGLIGSAGLGKSTIAAAVSDALDVPFLRSKDITRPILREYGYNKQKGDIVEAFLSKRDVEMEIVRRRLEEEALLSGGFVTDRTTLECFCYAFQSRLSYTADDFSRLEAICRGNMKNYTHIFRFSAGWMEDNGVRTTDGIFQRQVDLMIRGIVSEWGVRVIDVAPGISVADAARFIVSCVKKE